MSILWIYDEPINPQAGGTERATHLVMTAFEDRGYPTAGFLVFRQNAPREIHDAAGEPIDDLYRFLKINDVRVVVNQIGYSKWLLEEFLARGGARWKEEGGRIVTKLHFDPLMFSTGVRELLRNWRRRTPKQKLRRFGRIALLPLERRRAARTLRDAYVYLLAESDIYVILSEKHRQKLYDIAGTEHHDRVRIIANPNSFSETLAPEQLRHKSNTVLIVSRLDEPQKRVSLALSAWEIAMRTGKFSDWTLKVLGDGDYHEDYQKIVEKNQIANVEFVGRTDPEPFYQDAALYLHTAKREGWGLTIAEAMQNGVVPLVMRSSPVFDELISHDENGILTPNGNAKALAKNLGALMSSKEERERLALNAIIASHRYNVEGIFERWLPVLSRSGTTETIKCAKENV